MKKNTFIQLFLAISAMTVSLCHAQNPIVQNMFTADPAPMVHGDTMYLFTGHDEDSAPDNGFRMSEYLCFTTTDMVNWTQHAPVYNVDSLGWAKPFNANAAQATFRNGKYYYYIAPWSGLLDGGDCIAVVVSDAPYGPFKDAIGKPLIAPGQTTSSRHAWEDIDPTVFIDDDGQAYLYWGNNSLYCVKLNEDMISYSGEIMTFNIKDRAAFGPDYEEAPWLSKHNGTYYLYYAAHIPEAIYYATSSSPLGPWKYGGVMMEAMAQGCMSNHPGVIQFKGDWFLFYQNQDLPNGIDKRRCINIQPFAFNSDGSVPKIPHTKAGVVKGVGTLSPYLQTQAETMAWGEGVETAYSKNREVYVTDIQNGDYIKVRDVDFGKGAKSFEAKVNPIKVGGSIEIHLDRKTGILLGTCMINHSSASPEWTVKSCKTKPVRGVHDLYFVFKGGNGNLFDFDTWKFNSK